MIVFDAGVNLLVALLIMVFLDALTDRRPFRWRLVYYAAHFALSFYICLAMYGTALLCGLLPTLGHQIGAVLGSMVAGLFYWLFIVLPDESWSPVIDREVDKILLRVFPRLRARMPAPARVEGHETGNKRDIL